jgi:hypothetical protein
MSNYGSYPGPPQEPWGRQEPYGQPSDPWGGQPDPWGGTPSSTPPAGPASPAGYPGYDQGGYDQGGYQQPGYQQGGYDQGYEQHSPGYGSTRQYEQPSTPQTEPVWGQPVPPPPRKGGSRALILVVVALALLVVAGGVAAVIKLGGSDDNPGGGAAATSQAADPASSQEQSPAPENSTDARFVKAGQCVLNEGTEEKPDLKIAACGANTFEVLARFEGTIDYESKCKTVEGYRFHYFFDAELNTLDFVLCLKQR